MPGNLASLFAQHRDQPDKVLFRHFESNRWTDVTVAALAAAAARWQAAFRRDGIGRGDRVAICARNGVPWVACDLAALGMGIAVVPLYVDDNPDNVAWCVAHAQARLLIVENRRVATALGRLAQTYTLPPRVVLHADGDPGAEGDAIAADHYLPPDTDITALEIAELPDDTLATICFTSGTAGRPKGVMLSHGNIAANVSQCAQTHMARPTDRFLSVLPLSHMFERTGGYYLPLSIGAKVVFARGITQLADDLRTQQPTVMFAVPRILERFRARIEASLARSRLKRRLFDACVRRGYAVAQGEAHWRDRVLARALRARVGAPVLRRLGGRMRIMVVGGAALDPGLARTFIGLGLTVLQGYGMTEASPVIAVNRDDDNRPETVGPPLPGIEVRLGENGEALVRGANVMQGYWRDPEATRVAIDADGWLHTGDLGEFVGDKLRIRGRAKDIFVLSNGEKVPPQDAELAILRDPVFEQVMLVGDARPYVVLLAVTRERDERRLVERANAQLRIFPRWARVRQVIASQEPWSVDNGLLTPTLKLRRPALLQRFADRIEAAYREAAAP